MDSPNEGLPFELEIDSEKRPDLAAIVQRLQEKCSSSLFSFALYARTMWVLAQTACDKGSIEYEYCLGEARYSADDAGEFYPDSSVPALLADIPELCYTFGMAAERELARREAEERRHQDAEHRKAERVRINALIKANAWPDLNLPTPEALNAVCVFRRT